ncbi:MAG: hypothetical protein QOE58_1741, partial [Actinomycetota bacterium]|nr:hypothetical protein [Actinomycetota bacterium]
EHLDRADEHKDGLIASDNAIRDITRQRAALWDRPVTGAHGRQVTPAENRQQLTHNQQVAQHRIASGNREHLEDGQIGWKGHAAGVLAAGVEVMVTTRVFNINFGQLILLNFIAWLAVTVALIWFDIHVSQWYGHHRRAVRRLTRAAEALTPITIAKSRKNTGGAV